MGKSFSLPIVTSSMTHALTFMSNLFVDKGDMVLLPDKFWENYELLFGFENLRAKLGVFPFFNASGQLRHRGPAAPLLATQGRELEDDSRAQLPQQSYRLRGQQGGGGPDCGRHPVEAADEGQNLIVVTDDAYFGLFYGEGVAQGVALRPPGCPATSAC